MPDRRHHSRAGGRLRKWRIRLNRLRRSGLWGAPGLVHALFDAPTPRIARALDAPPVDKALVARIAANYRRVTDAHGNAFPAWGNLRPLIEALDAGDLDSLERHFAALFQGTLTVGMGNPEAVYFGDRVWRPGFAELRMTDLLLCLGEALGVLALPIHAQMKIAEYVDFVHADQDDLFKRIEDALGFSLSMPAAGRPPTFTLAGVRTSADMVRHAYVADRMRRLDVRTDRAIVEIGGGFGSLALLAHRAGFRDYVIVDLPAVGAIQTFFLGSALGADAVSGYGEAPAAIRLLPPPAIGELADGGAALAVNVDSLPEIPEGDGRDYLRQIRRVAPMFLSINQEAAAPFAGRTQTVVPRLVAEVGGFERVYRFRYWMMEGYAEELYRVVGRGGLRPALDSRPSVG